MQDEEKEEVGADMGVAGDDKYCPLHPSICDRDCDYCD